MLAYNTMRFGTDVLTASDSSGGLGVRKALFTLTYPLNTADIPLTTFALTGNEPTGTKRRIMLKTNSKIYRFVNGVLTEYTGAVNADNVLAQGNTVEELNALANVSELISDAFYPVIALSSSVDDNPTLKIAYTSKNTTEQKTCSANTATHPLPVPDGGTTPKITSITPDIVTTGNGSATIKIRLKSADGIWSDWMTLEQAVNREATRVQFQFYFSVETVDSDTAQVKSIAVNYISNQEVVTGSTAEIYSVIADFEADLRLCYLIVRHKQLIDSTIEAFVNFLPAYKTRERIQIGTGSGAAKQYTLGVNGTADTQIDPSSIRLFVDGIATDEFTYNTATGTVSISATSGVSILATYNYNCGLENWRQMTAERQQPYHDGTYMTRFAYTLPDDEDAQRANIRIRLNRPAGSVTNASLGKATGKTQQVVLPHVAIKKSIELNADFDYDFDSRILTFKAAKNTALKISYNYVGEQHQIYSWAAGWAPA